MPRAKAKGEKEEEGEKAPAAEEAETPKEAEPETNPYDIVLDYNLVLHNPDGIPVRVAGSIPFDGALLPAFLRDTSKTIEDTVESLVKARFLTQVRHFFNERMERELNEENKRRETAVYPAPQLPAPGERLRVPVLELEVDPGEPEIVDDNEEENRKVGGLPRAEAADEEDAAGEADEG